MTPANISFRSRSKARFVLPVLLVLLAIGGGLFAIGRRSTPEKKKEQKLEAPQVSFAVKEFNVFGEGGKHPSARADEKAIVTFFDAFYETAFVDPAQWKDPTFAALSASFAPEAKPSFTKDVAALTVAEGRAEFKRVEPSVAEIRISLYYDKGGHAAYAIAAAHFTAAATTNQKRRIDIAQDATYRLQRAGATWAIFSYQADAHQDTPSPTPSPSGSPT
ncbi:MAG: hypothetical protein ABR548_05645 [Actinomycetota bacterium]|nr:hypothetical protein [Actinomycetota bacterium]